MVSPPSGRIETEHGDLGAYRVGVFGYAVMEWEAVKGSEGRIECNLRFCLHSAAFCRVSRGYCIYSNMRELVGGGRGDRKYQFCLSSRND